MAAKDQPCESSDNKDTTGVVLDVLSDYPNMGKKERKLLVLQLLVESGLELPPQVIYHNCKRQGATFERTSVDNYLSELRSDGLVERIDKKTGYHRATEKGKRYYLEF
jgi:predicted transcriptional regulator